MWNIDQMHDTFNTCSLTMHRYLQNRKFRVNILIDFDFEVAAFIQTHCSDGVEYTKM